MNHDEAAMFTIIKIMSFEGGLVSDHIAQKTITYPSADGVSTVVATLWLPPSDVSLKGIVQISHGMVEHIMRYEAFAYALCNAGYIVAGNDHIGHGRSSAPEARGVLNPLKGSDILIKDTDTLRHHMTEQFGTSLPYVLFGHSMGSFIVRAYAGRYNEDLAGVIACGTGTVSPLLSDIGFAVAHHLCKTKSIEYRSAFVDNLGIGAYAKAVPGPTNYEWLSYNQKNISSYMADPACGYMFSVGGYAALAKLTKEACSKTSASHIPSTLPFLFIAGAEDPVGANGKGVRKAAQLTKDAGVTDVTTILYPHMRHEILNEDARETVFNDVISWLGSHHGNNTSTR